MVTILEVDGKRRIPMTVTFLEMHSRPAALPAAAAQEQDRDPARREPPSVHFYRYLYNTIGESYYWVDRRKLSDEALGEIVRNPQVELYVL